MLLYLQANHNKGQSNHQLISQYMEYLLLRRNKNHAPECEKDMNCSPSADVSSLCMSSINSEPGIVSSTLRKVSANAEISQQANRRQFLSQVSQDNSAVTGVEALHSKNDSVSSNIAYLTRQPAQYSAVPAIINRKIEAKPYSVNTDSARTSCAINLSQPAAVPTVMLSQNSSSGQQNLDFPRDPGFGISNSDLPPKANDFKSTQQNQNFNAHNDSTYKKLSGSSVQSHAPTFTQTDFYISPRFATCKPPTKRPNFLKLDGATSVKICPSSCKTLNKFTRHYQENSHANFSEHSVLPSQLQEAELSSTSRKVPQQSNVCYSSNLSEVFDPDVFAKVPYLSDYTMSSRLLQQNRPTSQNFSSFMEKERNQNSRHYHPTSVPIQHQTLMRQNNLSREFCHPSESVRHSQSVIVHGNTSDFNGHDLQDKTGSFLQPFHQKKSFSAASFNQVPTTHAISNHLSLSTRFSSAQDCPHHEAIPERTSDKQAVTAAPIPQVDGADYDDDDDDGQQNEKEFEEEQSNTLYHTLKESILGTAANNNCHSLRDDSNIESSLLGKGHFLSTMSQHGQQTSFTSKALSGLDSPQTEACSSSKLSLPGPAAAFKETALNDNGDKSTSFDHSNDIRNVTDKLLNDSVKENTQKIDAPCLYQYHSATPHNSNITETNRDNSLQLSSASESLRNKTINLTGSSSSLPIIPAKTNSLSNKSVEVHAGRISNDSSKVCDYQTMYGTTLQSYCEDRDCIISPVLNSGHVSSSALSSHTQQLCMHRVSHSDTKTNNSQCEDEQYNEVECVRSYPYPYPLSRLDDTTHNRDLGKTYDGTLPKNICDPSVTAGEYQSHSPCDLFKHPSCMSLTKIVALSKSSSVQKTTASSTTSETAYFSQASKHFPRFSVHDDDGSDNTHSDSVRGHLQRDSCPKSLKPPTPLRIDCVNPVVNEEISAKAPKLAFDEVTDDMENKSDSNKPCIKSDPDKNAFGLQSSFLSYLMKGLETSQEMIEPRRGKRNRARRATLLRDLTSYVTLLFFIFFYFYIFITLYKSQSY